GLRARSAAEHSARGGRGASCGPRVLLTCTIPSIPMNYEVAAPIVSGTAEASADARRDATAIFIAHGMGQQVPFETIDVMARGICEQSHGHVDRISARTIRVDCERLQRLELEFDDGRPPIHIYEGYWAPMTEGVI